MTALPELPVRWRPRLGRLVPYGLLPLVAGCLLAVGLVMAPEVGPEDMTFYGVVGAIVLTALQRFGQPRLDADEEGLVVVNLVRRRRLEWAEVIGVSMAEGEPWPTLDLADGTTLAVMGIQSADGDRAARAVGQLQALLDARSDAPEPG